MLDPDFLPDWYNRLQRRRRALGLQVCIVLLVAGAVAVWVYAADRNERRNSRLLKSIEAELVQADQQIEQMKQLEQMRREMTQKVAVLNNLGGHVNASRLIARIAQVMPTDVALVNLLLELEESPVALSGAARASLKDPAKAPMDRRLRVRLQGIAPTDVELATFLIELNKVPFFERIAPTYARDRSEGGRQLREFELLFWLNLNLPAGEHAPPVSSPLAAGN